MNRYIKALSIAGSDSGGGAGIQADLRTFAMLGCFGMTAVTAITAQNTLGVQSVFPLPPAIVKAQLESILSDIGADVIKIGMMVQPETIDVILEHLSAYPTIPIVLDPVMYAKGGCQLLELKAMESLKRLLPFTFLLTPNLPEASVLLGRSVKEKKDMPGAAFDLLQMGAQHVLLKGGHLESSPGSDCLCSTSGKIEWFETPTVKTENTHGTGCTLSSAIAAYLARGHGISEATLKGKKFLQAALLAGKHYKLGSGHGPANGGADAH